MPKSQTTYVYVDPRFLEGSPYEVAGKAIEQAERAAELLDTALTDANVLARNAELQRQLDTTQTCSAERWDAGLQARILTGFKAALAEHGTKLSAAKRAASFDPATP